MTGIKPTVFLFRVWQRELDGVLAHFSTTYTFYYCGYTLTLPWSSCYSSHMTPCDCDLWHNHPSYQLWHCDKVTWYFPTLHFVVVSPRKEKKKKRNINNDLAILPSHDTTPLLSFLVPRNFLQLVVWVYHVAHFVFIFLYLFSNSWFFFLSFFFCFWDRLHRLSFRGFLALPSSPVLLHSSPIFLVVPLVWPSVQHLRRELPW